MKWANGILDYIRMSGDLPFYSAVARSHLKYCAQFWALGDPVGAGDLD